MEDAHAHILSLPGDQDTCFFGVFDGHGGSESLSTSISILHLYVIKPVAVLCTSVF